MIKTAYIPSKASLKSKSRPIFKNYQIVFVTSLDYCASVFALYVKNGKEVKCYAIKVKSENSHLPDENISGGKRQK